MDTPPAKLYKYFAPERSSFFEDWLIRFTQPGALNDPFEMRPHIAGFGTQAEELALASDRWENHAKGKYDKLVKQRGHLMSYKDFRAKIERFRSPMIQEAIAKSSEQNPKMARKFDEILNSGMGILSLSETPDSLLMWPHYGDSHRGFVIEFDTLSPFFKQERPPECVEVSEENANIFAKEYGRLRKISYVNDRPSEVVTKMCFSVLLTKGMPWKYEDEWRMLMPLEYAEEKRIPDRFGYPVCLFRVPQNAVTKVILGCAANAELVDRVLTLRDRNETQHVAIEQARVDERYFQLRFDSVGC